MYDSVRVDRSLATYYPLHLNNLVFGSVAVQRFNFLLSEVKHLVVHPLFRRMGLAKHLLSFALGKVETPLVYASIRKENKASVTLFVGALPQHGKR